MSDREHGRFLRQAVELARTGMQRGDGGPFGCVVVRGGKVLAEGWNSVLASSDPTAHAEIVAIRRACAELGSFQLDGCTVYASCEPCPMCLGALYWARPVAVFFAATRADAAAAGFDDAFIYDEIGLAPQARTLPVTHLPDPLSVAALQDWPGSELRVTY